MNNCTPENKTLWTDKDMVGMKILKSCTGKKQCDWLDRGYIHAMTKKTKVKYYNE